MKPSPFCRLILKATALHSHICYRWSCCSINSLLIMIQTHSDLVIRDIFHSLTKGYITKVVNHKNIHLWNEHNSSMVHMNLSNVKTQEYLNFVIMPLLRLFSPSNSVIFLSAAVCCHPSIKSHPDEWCDLLNFLLTSPSCNPPVLDQLF
jgi:hypothetical protein